MKKALCVLLALALMLSLSVVPAFASGEASGASGEASASMDFFSSMTAEITGPYEIEETEVETESHGLTLRGILTVPVTGAEGEKFPVAVLTHGFNGGNFDVADIAEALGKNGVASVRFNLTSYGDSDGEYVDVTFTTEKEDVLAALEFAKSLDFADTDNLFLIGKSQGGFDSCLASLDCEDEIKALILWYPAICIPDDFKSGRVQFVTFDPEIIPETLSFMGMFEVSRAFIEEGMSIDPLKDFTTFQKDVLIIHGTSDFIVNYDYAVELADAYPSAELITIEGGGHGFMGEGLTLALDATVAFVLDHVAGDAEQFSLIIHEPDDAAYSYIRCDGYLGDTPFGYFLACPDEGDDFSHFDFTPDFFAGIEGDFNLADFRAEISLGYNDYSAEEALLQAMMGNPGRTEHLASVQFAPEYGARYEYSVVPTGDGYSLEAE